MDDRTQYVFHICCVFCLYVDVILVMRGILRVKHSPYLSAPASDGSIFLKYTRVICLCHSWSLSGEQYSETHTVIWWLALKPF